MNLEKIRLDKLKNFDPSGVGLQNGNFIGLPFSEAESELVILPVPWDATVSFGAGTATGPANILAQSPQLDLYDEVFPEAWKKGIFFRKPSEKLLRLSKSTRKLAASYIKKLEKGKNRNEVNGKNLAKINSACESMILTVQKEAFKLLEQGKIVGLIGGDHSTPLGFLRALAEKHSSFGILHLDAHLDLRDSYEGFTYSHASIFRNALKLKSVKKLVSVGIRDYCKEEIDFAKKSPARIKIHTQHQINNAIFKNTSWTSYCQKLIKQLPKKVYISFDIDALEPSNCPNTGTPVPGRLTFDMAMHLLNLLGKANKTIIGFDLCEVAGKPHDWDGNVGARVLYKLGCLGLG